MPTKHRMIIVGVVVIIAVSVSIAKTTEAPLSAAALSNTFELNTRSANQAIGQTQAQTVRTYLAGSALSNDFIHRLL